MLIVPYWRTLTVIFHGCVHHGTAGIQTSTCHSSIQHMYQGVRSVDSSMWNTTGGYCSEVPAVCPLPTKTWIQGLHCSHAGLNMSLIPFLSLPFILLLGLLDPPSWSVLEQFTPGVLVCCRSWWDRERQREDHICVILKIMPASKTIKTNYPVTQSVLLKQPVFSLSLVGQKERAEISIQVQHQF